MTQNKQFKKRVRARMAETGESYMQARRALGGDEKPAEEAVDLDEVRKALRRTWHEVYDTWTIEFHVYEDGPEDGRVHVSLCRRAKTKTFETKTPGKRLCEDCKLLKVRAILERQKIIGDPLNLLNDPEGWAAAGGDEAERIATRDDLWGPPPEPVQLSATTMELSTPFNSGWYWHDSEYPDEGTQGVYRTREDAEQGARLAGYDPEDPDSVTFIEQKTPSEVIQRFLIEHLQKEIKTHIVGAVGFRNSMTFREQLKKIVGERLRDVVKQLEKQGVLTPPEDDVVLTLEPTTEQDLEEGRVRVKVTLRDSDRYPQVVRDLVEAGSIDPRYLVRVSCPDA